jgi:hypothetical protein
MRSTSRIAKVDESQFDVVGRGAVSADRSGIVRSYPVTSHGLPGCAQYLVCG